ncbi:protein FAM83G-like [Betta splendens]|uniref:Protein FAM83G-like n=1 Tax=Betta splendens TaxID=158456 RepID=A0A6P7KSY0_BETSP|nr:protein FAM83G-like [Betta splendens]
MDVSSVSVLWYKRSKPLGKVRRRVQDLRVPASSIDCSAITPTLELSHNESARLAVDCLLSQGMEGYEEMLHAEGEVDFLSELEKSYILANGTDGKTDDPGACDERDLKSMSAASLSTLPSDTEPTVADFQVTGPVLAQPSVEIYFQYDSKSAGLKDVLREFIRKANMALAIVIDTFSDVELLCDLLEASRKRNVSVYLLLDHHNLNLFISMWQDLKLNSSDFPKLSVRSAHGQTYCARSGRKLTGEIAENLIMADWTEVLTGSFSFSWLSWQVNRSLGVLVKGSAVTPFHQEFRRLYFSSTPVPGFVTFITLPLHISHAIHHNNCGISEKKSSHTKPLCKLDGPEDVQCSQIKTKIQILSNPENPGVEHSKGNDQLQHKVAVDEQQHTKPPQLYTPGVSIATLCNKQTYVDPLEANQKQGNSPTNCLGQTQVSNIQSQFVSLNMSTIADKKVHELNPTRPPQRTVRYQTTLKKHLSHLPSESPTVPATSQPFSHSGQHSCGFNPKVSSLGPRQHCQPPLQPSRTTHGHGLKLTPRAEGTFLHANAKMFSPGSTAKLHLQHHSIQQVRPPLLNWKPQSPTVRTRPVARTSSFDSTYGTGQTTAGLLGWRSSRNMTTLGRSKSLTERSTTTLYPNTTTI